MVNKQLLKEMVEQHYVSVQKHPEAPYFIYNYTQKAQFDKVWNEVTIACRGLILDESGKVIARPFDKFFNSEETPDKIPQNTTFKAYDKMDGSLGILYELPDKTPAIATRGSFLSEQALRGTTIFMESLDKLDRNWHRLFNVEKMTYLFEIIYPENRIVVDYKGARKLVFLGARDLSL